MAARATAVRGPPSAARRARDALLHARDLLQLLGELQGLIRRRAGRGLRFVARGELREQGAPELVVVLLVGLDDVAVEGRGVAIPAALAEADELRVAHDGERLARELPGRDALHRRPERQQVREQRRRRTRVERGRIGPRRAELFEPLLDEAQVL